MSEKISFNQIQGFLLSNAISLVGETGRDLNLIEADFEQGDDSKSFGFQPVVVKKVISDEDASDTISDLVNSFSSANQTDFVTDIPDEVRVQLRPTYRIYKTLILDEGRRINLELKSSITGESTIQNPGVVVKNIEISNLGGNLEEINNNLEVTITLYATKLDHFFEKQFPGAIKNSRFTTPPEAEKIIRNGVSWVDLLKLNLQDLDLSQIEENIRQTNLANRETKKQILSDIPLPYVHKEPEQRIRLEISYGDVQDIQGYSESQMSYIRNLVNSQKEILELSLVANEVNFNEDGTAELVVQFRGSHGTNIIDRRNDLLYDPFIEDLSLQLDDEIEILEFIIEKGYVSTGDIDAIRYVINSHKTFEFFGFERGVFEPQSVPLGEEQVSFRIDVERFTEVEGIKERREAYYRPLIEERREAKKILSQYQSGLLIRGLYGPTLFINQYSGSDLRTATQERLASAPVQDRKSRVYTLYPQIGAVTKFAKQIFEGRTERVYNSYDFYIDSIRSAALGGVGSEALKGFYQLRNRKRTTASLENISDDPAVFNEGNRTEIDFVFFGDIIEVALEVLSSNNRYGTEQKDFESKIASLSSQIVKNPNITSVGTFSDWYYTYVRPFYARFGGGNPIAELAQRQKSLQELDQSSFEAYPEYVSELIGKIDTLQRTISEVEQTNTRRIDEIYQNIGEILMSEIVYTNPSNPQNEIKINIADVPICIDKLISWFNEKVNARQKSTLFLRDYINQLLLFLRDILAERYDDANTADKEPPEPLVNRFFVQSSRYDFLAPYTRSEKVFAANEVHISDIRQFSNKISQNSSLYAKPITIISQSPSISKTNRDETNRRVVDRANNIPHIIFGDATNGILQQINFSKIDMPGVREARLLEGNRLYYGQDFQGPNILSERYNATLELVGTTFFRPTSMFYLDPRPLELGYAKNVASPARLLGLGGYYVVIRVVQSLNFAGSATWTTTLETVWESFGDKTDIGGSATSLSDLKISSFNGRLALATDTEKEELPIIERPEAAPLVSGEEYRRRIEEENARRRLNEELDAPDPLFQGDF